jgi:hypothetical protein
MKHLELHRFKRAIGAITFGIFFPNENKRLDQKHGIGKQLDLVLVTPGTQTKTVNYLRELTGWTVKKATAFFKEGHYPKVVIYNVNVTSDTTSHINKAVADNIIFEIY